MVVDAKVVDKDVKLPEERTTNSSDTLEADSLAVLLRPTNTSQKGLQTIFDCSSVVQRLTTPLVVVALLSTHTN